VDLVQKGAVEVAHPLAVCAHGHPVILFPYVEQCFASRNGETEMICAEQNTRVTQTGPGTPMGDLFQGYCLPVLLSEALPKNDRASVRVKILSDRPITFQHEGSSWVD
jgi:hypothetical protein